MYACLKEAQTELSLFSCADEIAWTNIMFKYWYSILQFQTDYLVFIRSLFLNVLQSLVKWFLIFDQYHYAKATRKRKF